MNSFETAFERAQVAEDIVRHEKRGYQPCEGLIEARWHVPHLGALCMLNYYSARNIWQDGEMVTTPTPFFFMHMLCRLPDGSETVAKIDFDANFAYVRQSQPVIEGAWDTAMATMDEALRTEHTNLYDSPQPLPRVVRLDIAN